ncbi:MAG: hypothetical protein K0S09_1472 [Sphingobacteriaceae bacterium]|jgi:hypothetical protein|nr:hypothetical protein [Sphingobacteriaceae bacterium]
MLERISNVTYLTYHNGNEIIYVALTHSGLSLLRGQRSAQLNACNKLKLAASQ